MDTDDFDLRAATWDDDPAKVERARAVAAALRAALPLGADTRVLEYGAGTGLVTEALRSSVGAVTLVDTSAGMRAVIEAKVAAGQLAGARVWDLDLATTPPPDERFDLVVTVMTLHHIEVLDPVLAAFAHLLDDGGHLCVVDLDEEDGSFHGGGFGGHRGFDRQVLADRLRRAGFTDVTFGDGPAVVRDTGTFPLFVATARRGTERMAV